MAQELKLWLRQESAALCGATMQRTKSNVQVTEDDLIEFLSMLAMYAGSLPELQLSAVQGWAIVGIGQDAPRAYEWLTILRILKEEIGKALTANFIHVERSTIGGNWMIF